MCKTTQEICIKYYYYQGFPGGAVVKNPVLIPGSGRSPGVGNGNPLQYSCLENSMNRRALQAADNGVEKSQTRLVL